MPGQILFPTDYSEASNAALPFAVALARQSNASLLVLHVEPNGKTAGTSANRRGNEERAGLEFFLASLSQSGPTPIAHEIRSLPGNAADQIAQVALEEQVESILMATAGRTGLGRLVMGSVAQAVMRSATCPVLTVKQPFPAHARSEVPVPDSANERADKLSALVLLERAIAARATDIHLDPSSDGMEVRFRIDGRLERFCRLSPEVAHSLATQLKVMAQLDISNPFLAQEGQLELPEPLASQEVRLTRVRVVGGESIALRLHSRNRLVRPLETLGLSARSLSRIQEMLRLTEGIVLVTGPTGSGKTTTAYSLVHALDDGQRNIVTIEDPPEYHVPGFRQMIADVRHGISMSSGLRSLLRMDPDLVLVGEIRDVETVQVAMRAAASGKYVFTTLHARDVAATITALRDLQVDDGSLAANLTGMISQRLVRRVCSHCRVWDPIGPTAADQFIRENLDPPEMLPRAVGCSECHERGYHERIGVFEVVICNRAIRDAIAQGESEEDLRDLIRSEGTYSLLADGLLKVACGQTTLDEVNTMTWAKNA
jgi:type II secretory ATPase GspE/PulE/Tfp pilus assembly ATPase PilB-like protein